MVISREYKEFLKGVRPKITLYEKACNFAEKILKIRMGKETEQRVESAIRFCYLNISPSGPISLVTILFLVFMLILIPPFLLGILTPITFVASIVMLIFASYYLYSYPFLKVKIIRAKASTEMILATLYMAVALRDVPNLESAIKFAGDNAAGVIALDLKKIIWDLQTQRYYSIEPAMEEFLDKWGKENEEFVETVKILQGSIQQPPQSRLALIDEAINVLLTGTVERMKHYALDLRMPVMMIYSLGIVLPIIALIIFPIVMIFLQQFANIWILIMGYDIILPIGLYWIINTTLDRKPPTFSQPQIGADLAKTTMKSTRFKMEISIWFLILPIFFIFLFVGGTMIYNYYLAASPCRDWSMAGYNTTKPEGLSMTKEECRAVLEDAMTPTIAAAVLLWGIGLTVGISCILLTHQRLKLRDKVKKLEREFTEALFQLGHQMSTGHSVETALEKSRVNLKNMEIANFYGKILSNINVMGMTFESAVFDENYGAIKSYPSDLIKSIMSIIVDASKKGLQAVSTSALTISKYLKGMHQVEEQINEVMSEVVTSMKFLGLFLAPMVAGVTVAMAVIILNILIILSNQFMGIGGGIDVPTSASFLMFLWKGGINITPDIFQLVLGIYVIETSYLLGRFINGIENGEDSVGELSLVGKLALFSTLIYTVTLFITYMMFYGVIGTLLLGGPV